MKKLANHLKLFITVLMSLTIYNSVNAQQNAFGLRAPAKIKIDGKLDEWSNTLPNFNKSTNVYYAISNDDKNLYLSIQTTDPVAVSQIISNAVSFSFYGSKKDERTTLTFPLLKSNDFKIVDNFKKKIDATDVVASAKLMDSLAKVMNKDLVQHAKQIKVEGLNKVADTLSIYNEQDIQIALAFNYKRVLNYELALPLAFVRQKINNEAEINYTVQLNGVSTSGVRTELSADGNYITRTDGGKMRLELKATPQLMAAFASGFATNFTGKYTLAK